MSRHVCKVYRKDYSLDMIWDIVPFQLAAPPSVNWEQTGIQFLNACIPIHTSTHPRSLPGLQEIIENAKYI